MKKYFIVGFLALAFAVIPIKFAHATTAPVIITNTGWSGNGPWSGSFSGTLTDMGGDSIAMISIQYGPTTAYGMEINAGTVSSPETRGITTLNLSCDTVYHFRAIARNSLMEGHGSDMTFTTPPCSTAKITTVSSSSITSTSAVLTGNFLSATTSASAPMGYGKFIYSPVPVAGHTDGTNGLFSSVVPFTSVGSDYSVTVSDLICNTPYRFNAYGMSATSADDTFGPEMIFTTLSCAPVVTTLPATSITSTSVTINGNLNSLGGATAVNVGFEYGLTTAYGSGLLTGVVQSTPGTFHFDLNSSIFTPVACGTVYHYHVFASGIYGSGFGDDMTFTTLPCAPTVTTLSATSITTTDAVLNGSYIGFAGPTWASGFNFGTTTSYSSTSSATFLSTDPASFSTTVGSLSCGTTYHYRATVWPMSGTVSPGYGSDMSFTTLPCATVATISVSSITSSGATFTGNLISLGGFTTVPVGFQTSVLATYGSPTVSSLSLTAPGTFTQIQTGLVCNTFYHFRAFAWNMYGPTANGADMTFTTLPCAPVTLPVVVTNATSGITATNVNFNGNITSGTAITSRGFKYATSPMYYDIAGGTVTQSSGPYGTGTFTAPINASVEFSCGYTYYFKAFATNSAGTAYGADQSFTTLPCAATTVKRVATNGTTGVTATTATLIGNLISIPGTTAVTVGFQYGNTTTYGTTVAVGSRTSGGIYTKPLTGLLHNHLYHFRAYISSSTGTIYGSDQTVTTLP